MAARYSPLEAPFYKRMNFIFAGSSTIYGFDQLSPLGKHIKGSLQGYLQDIRTNYGSYYRYLKKEGYKRKKNKELLARLSHTTVNQAYLPSLKKDKKNKMLFQDKCMLFNDQEPFPKKS